jgi:hypothetical protein
VIPVRPTLAALVFALGCGGGGATPRDAATPDVPASPDVPTSPDVPASPDVVADAVRPDADPAAPNISVALDCGRGMGGSGPGPANADSLQRAVIDTRAFPDAICNDGSPAAIYFRPYRGEANRNRWVINLRGGGGCGEGQSCAARWCGCVGMRLCPATPEATYTNFDRGNMISDGPASQLASGIFLRGDAARPNPLGDYNQVRVVYCSSDAWAGTRRAAPLVATHPVSGAPVAYTMHFLGSRILDAVLATLRQDGGRVAPYTLAGMNAPLPDLDDAAEVILAGDSAGGSGVINNLDRVTAALRARNTACPAGGACPLVVRGLIDAVVGPDKSRLTPSPTGRVGMAGYTTYAAFATASAQRRAGAQGYLGDESCRAWHAANLPGTDDVCSDEMHVVRHHLTTPFFVRMALRDGLISGNYFEEGWVAPALGPFDAMATVFARVLQVELSAFPMMRTTAEEGAGMTAAPGVFAPNCTKHDTINTDSEVYGVTVTPTGGRAARLLDTFEAWRTGVGTGAVLSDPRANATVCPP